MYVQPSSKLLAILNVLIGKSGLLNAPAIILFTNAITPTPNTVIGDLTECTATGYTRGSVTWGTAAVNTGGFAEVWGSMFSTIFTDGGTTPVTIYGYALTDTGFTDLLLAELLPQPLTTSYNGEPLNVLPYYQVSQ